MKKVYIVTGANGFLGNTVLRKLVSARQEVRALLLPGDPVRSIENIPCRLYRGDITQPETLTDLFQKDPQEELTVIHCAAMVYIKSKPNPQVFRVNVEGTKNIIQKCLEHSAKLVYINSVHAIPEPEDDRKIVEIGTFLPDSVEGIYAASKAAAAQAVLDAIHHRGLHGVILQPSGIIGPGDYGSTHLTALIRTVIEGRLPAVVTGGYDFVDVRDVADGILAAAEKGRDGECYILSNRFVSIRELVDMACKYSGTPAPRLTLPLSAAALFAPLCEAYYTVKKQTPLFTRYSLYTLKSKSGFSHAKADRELGYRPRAMEETIADTVEWLSPAKALSS